MGAQWEPHTVPAAITWSDCILRLLAERRHTDSVPPMAEFMAPDGSSRRRQWDSPI